MHEMISKIPWLVSLEVTASVISIVGAIYWIYRNFFYKDTQEYEKPYAEGITNAMKDNSTDALVFLSYYRYSDNRPPICFKDRLYDEDTAPFLFAVTAEEREKSYMKFIRQLFGMVKKLDKNLRMVNQGKLIRNIFDVEHGGLLYNKIGEDEYLFGVCLNQSKIMEAEKDMQKVVNAILIFHGIVKKGSDNKEKTKTKSNPT